MVFVNAPTTAETVVAALLIKAIGKQLVCVHVNHGLMRKNESESVVVPNHLILALTSLVEYTYTVIL